MSDGLIRLVVADDHGMIVAGVKVSFSGTNIAVIDSTNDPHSVLSLYQLHKPDIVLCDIRFGDSHSGIDVLKQILSFDKDAKVVMFSQFDDGESILTAYQLGARAFLTKEMSHFALIKALNAVQDGTVHIEPSIAIKLARGTIASEFSAVQVPPKIIASPGEIPRLLNEKELAIFRLSAQFTATEIAEQMGFTTRTISSINSSIRLKLNLDLHDRKALKDAAIQFQKHETCLQT